MPDVQWMAQITGEKYDLKLLAEIFTEEPAKIYIIRGEYWLGGSFLNGIINSMDVVDKAWGRLELMLGAARIESGNDSLSASLCGIYECQDDHGIKTRVLPLSPATISIGSRISVWLHEPGTSRAYVRAAEEDKHLDFAVRLWADSSRTWPRLYRILEEVYVSFRNKENEHQSEVLSRFGLVDSKEDYLRFAHSANEVQQAGKDSRHAMGNNRPPQEAEGLDFISHAEAVQLVRNCLKRALEFRSNSSGE